MIESIKAKIGTGTLIRDLSQFDLKFTPFMAIDIETFGSGKKPGDSPYFDKHGIAGIALGNLNGDAVYISVNDGKDYKGVPIQQAIAAINTRLNGVKVLALHYAKFDLGFLIKRGLDISKVRVVDTWMLHSIKSSGKYESNKLKDIARAKFGATTETEAEKDKWMAENNTQDYGEVPVEIMAKYAYDDVRYTLMILMGLFTKGTELTVEDWSNHDLYMRNTLGLIAAEDRGIYVNIPLIKEYLSKLTKLLGEDRTKLQSLLGAVDVDVDDDQKMLAYMHSKNLHSPPWNKFGKLQYSYDSQFLRSVDHPLAEAYMAFHIRKMFVTCFSANNGEMLPRIFSTPGGEAGFHPGHLLNVFSKGGSSTCKTPDITDRVSLQNEVRKVFAPRRDHTFTVIRAFDLPTILLAYYCNNSILLELIRGSTLKDNPSAALRYTMTKLNEEKNEDIASLLLLQVLDGTSSIVLERRLAICDIKLPKKGVFELINKMNASFEGLAPMQTRLNTELQDKSFVRDRAGRVLKIDDKQRYRSVPLLIQSSVGSILSIYLDLLLRLSKETGASLVLAHGNEFLFEVPDDKKDFQKNADALLKHKHLEPHPKWLVQHDKTVWQSEVLDSHCVALEKL